MSGSDINLTLKIWRQASKNDKGSFVEYTVNVSPDSSFLEMIDELNNSLEKKGEEPIVFESDCREGICGTCNLVINGHPHGPIPRIATCQLHMRNFKDGETIYVEPFRASSFPVIKDLMVDRSSFDRIMHAGGFVSVNTGGVPDANEIPIPKQVASDAFDAAACIGCGACVAACKNSSAMLFVGAKVSQYALLPQGQPRAYQLRTSNPMRVPFCRTERYKQSFIPSTPLGMRSFLLKKRRMQRNSGKRQQARRCS